MNSKPKKIANLVHGPRGINTISLIQRDLIELGGSQIDPVQISQGKYAYIEIYDAVIDNSSFDNVTCFNANIHRSKITKTTMTGLQLPGSTIENVIFKNCRLNLANFRNARIKNCLFIDCDLTEADFTGCQLKNVMLDSCQLNQTDFNNCSSNRLEIINSSLSTIIGVRGLKGSSISPINLVEISPLLAEDLHIKVRDN